LDVPSSDLSVPDNYISNLKAAGRVIIYRVLKRMRIVPGCHHTTRVLQTDIEPENRQASRIAGKFPFRA
jgi:hypothetical protein